MITLNPAENFPIMRGIGNHLDTDTYYVKAFIRDANTDATIAEVELVDKGGQRFQKSWKVSYDNVYQRGRYITIVTSVYTDSGYTTKSENYADEFETYLIQQRWDMATMAGLGGGSREPLIEKEAIKEAVREVLEEKEKKDKPLEDEKKDKKSEKQKPLDISLIIKPLTKEITVIKKQIDSLPKFEKPEKPDKVNLKPLERAMDKMTNEISKLPRFEKTNLSPVVEAMQDLLQSIRDDNSERAEELIKAIKDITEKGMTTPELVLEFKKIMKEGDIAEKRKKHLNQLKSQFT